MKRAITLLLTLTIILSTVLVPVAFADDDDDHEGYKVKETKHYVYTIVDGKAIIGYYKGKQSTVKIPSKLGGKPVVEFGRQLDVWDAMWDIGLRDNKYVKKIVFPKSVKEINMCSVFRNKNLESVTIKGATFIGESAFEDCTKLKKISLPACLKTIKPCAFSNTALSGKFTIGKNIKEFDASAIEDTKINRFSVVKGNKRFSTKSGVLYNKNKTKLIAYPCDKKLKTFKTIKKTKTIAALSFYGTKNLKTIIYSPNIQVVEDCSMEYCSQLEKMVFKSKNKLTISEVAFDDLKKLNKVLFKTKEEITIGNRAFLGCTSLKCITIPKKVVSIGKKAFGYKSYSKKIKCFTIKGYKGTAAEKYAKKNGFKFIALDK